MFRTFFANEHKISWYLAAHESMNVRWLCDPGTGSISKRCSCAGGVYESMHTGSWVGLLVAFLSVEAYMILLYLRSTARIPLAMAIAFRKLVPQLKGYGGRGPTRRNRRNTSGFLSCPATPFVMRWTTGGIWRAFSPRSYEHDVQAHPTANCFHCLGPRGRSFDRRVLLDVFTYTMTSGSERVLHDVLLLHLSEAY